MTNWPEWSTDDGRIRLINADCLEVLPTLSGIDAVVTDPPYGCDKAEWDGEFFGDWYCPAKSLGCPIYIVTGSLGVKDSVRLVGDDFVDVISARNLNGMTRGPIGFGNWLACVVACGKPRQGPNVFDFNVLGEMPDHPSPKPIQYMVKLVKRISEPHELLCDPLAGSMTTAIACIRTGRQCVCIERERSYWLDGIERVKEELGRTVLFDRPPARQAELIA